MEYKCPVCGNEVPEERDDLFCSDDCLKFFTLAFVCEDRKERPCWISLEVFCRDGNCLECEVYKVELEIKRRGLNKDELIGNY